MKIQFQNTKLINSRKIFTEIFLIQKTLLYLGGETADSI